MKKKTSMCTHFLPLTYAHTHTHVHTQKHKHTCSHQRRILGSSSQLELCLFESSVQTLFLLTYSHEAMNDLIALMAQLTDVNHRILIPGIYDSVQPLTDEELKTYDNIDFDHVCIF